MDGITDRSYKADVPDEEIQRKCWEYIFAHYIGMDKSGMWEYLKGYSWWDLKTEEAKREAREELLDLGPTVLMVTAVLRNAGDGSAMFGWRGNFENGDRTDEQKRVYEILGLYGYQMSEEERQMLDGTHELYFREEV